MPLKVKKAKKRLKKILDAKNFTVESKKETDVIVDKKAKIQANKRDVNAKRIARVSSKGVQNETKNNISNDDDTCESITKCTFAFSFLTFFCELDALFLQLRTRMR